MCFGFFAALHLQFSTCFLVDDLPIFNYQILTHDYTVYTKQSHWRHYSHGLLSQTILPNNPPKCLTWPQVSDQDSFLSTENRLFTSSAFSDSPLSASPETKTCGWVGGESCLLGEHQERAREVKLQMEFCTDCLNHSCNNMYYKMLWVIESANYFVQS